jgi:hypothetical protein
MTTTDRPGGLRDADDLGPDGPDPHRFDRAGTQAKTRTFMAATLDAPTVPTRSAASRLRRLLPSTARTRTIGWVLLLVLAALAVVTFVTWRLLIQVTDERMDRARADPPPSRASRAAPTTTCPSRSASRSC